MDGIIVPILPTSFGHSMVTNSVLASELEMIGGRGVVPNDELWN
jgi:hypothetical protein